MAIIPPDRETLQNYLHGKLSDAESDQIAQLVADDPELQGRLEELDRSGDTFIDLLRQDKEDTPTEGYSEFGPVLDLAKKLFDRENGEFILQEQEDPTANTLGEYKLIERIGQGGMGVVFKARHTKLGRTVAIKVICDARATDARAIARFEREIKAIGQLNHPSIVHAHDAREIDGRSVLVMEYVDGLDLGRLIRRHGPVSTADACELIRQTAVGLQAAHELGLVHRDIKPSNLMLDREGNVKILDLGLAREAVDLGELQREVSMSFDLTQTGQAMGTADYMAPEQASHPGMVDIRADIYSMGCTLFKLLTGRAPYHEEMTFDKLSAHAEIPLPPTPGLSDSLRKILDRMTAKDPADRFSTPEEVAKALEPFCSGHDLPDLLTRAESQTAPAHTIHRPAAGGRFRRIGMLLLLMFFFGGLGLAGGIILTIEQNGQKTTVEFPDNTEKVNVDKDGNMTARLGKTVGNTLSEKEKEIEKLVGTWKLVSAIENDKVNPAPAPTEEVFLDINHKFISYRSATEKLGTIPCEIDVTKVPKRINWPAGTNSIYKIERDLLTIRFTGSGQKPPTDFISAPDGEIFTYVFEREKTPSNKGTTAKTSVPQLSENQGESGGLTGEWEFVSALNPTTNRMIFMYGSKPRLRFTKNYVEWITTGEFHPVLMYKTDTTTKPRRITFGMALNEKEQRIYGIYKIEGDQLILCMETDHFPADFTINAMRLKRVEPAEQPGPPYGTTKTNELDRKWLTGTQWKCIAATGDDGEPIPMKDLKMKLRFEGDYIQASEVGDDRDKVPFALDATANPKRISWPHGMEHYSIYKIEGNRLTICVRDPKQKGHPTSFEVDKHQGIFVWEDITKREPWHPRTYPTPPTSFPKPYTTTSPYPSTTYPGTNGSSQPATVATPVNPEHLWNIAPYLSPIKLRASTFYEIETGVTLDITNQPGQGVRWEGKKLRVTWPKGFTSGSYTYTEGFHQDPKARTLQWPITPSVSDGNHNYSYQVKFLTSPPPELKNAEFRVELLDAKAQPVWTNTVQCTVQTGLPQLVKPVDKNNVDRQKLFGLWKCVSVQVNGYGISPPNDAAEIKISINKDRIMWPNLSGPPHTTASIPLNIDATTNPKRIGFPYNLEDYSIYQLEGDRLTICYSPHPGHPTKFVSEPNSANHTLIVFERVKDPIRGAEPVAARSTYKMLFPSLFSDPIPTTPEYGTQPTYPSTPAPYGTHGYPSTPYPTPLPTTDERYAAYSKPLEIRFKKLKIEDLKTEKAALLLDLRVSPPGSGKRDVRISLPEPLQFKDFAGKRTLTKTFSPDPSKRSTYYRFSMPELEIPIKGWKGKIQVSVSGASGKGNTSTSITYADLKKDIDAALSKTYSAEKEEKDLAWIEKSPYAVVTFQEPQPLHIASTSLRNDWIRLPDQEKLVSGKIESLWLNLPATPKLQKRFKITGPTTLFLRNGKEVFRVDGPFSLGKSFLEKLDSHLPPIQIGIGKGPQEKNDRYLVVSNRAGQIQRCAGKTLRVTWPESVKIDTLTAGYRNLKKQSVEWSIPSDVFEAQKLHYQIDFHIVAFRKKAEFRAELLDPQGKVEWTTATQHDLVTGPAPMVRAVASEADELQNLRGLWKCISAQCGRPEDIAGTDFTKLKIMFGDNFFQWADQKGKDPPSFKIDATTTPKQIHSLYGKENWNFIYKLDGNRLTLCFNENPQETPTGFVAKKGSTNCLFVFERETPLDDATAVRDKTVSKILTNPYTLITFMTPDSFRSYAQGSPIHEWTRLNQQCLLSNDEKFDTFLVVLGPNSKVLEKSFKVNGPTTIFLKDGKEIFRHEEKLADVEKLWEKMGENLSPISIVIHDAPPPLTPPGSFQEKIVYLSIFARPDQMKRYVGKTLHVTWPEGLKVEQLTKGYQHLNKKSVQWIIPKEIKNPTFAVRSINFRANSNFIPAEFRANLLDEKGVITWSTTIKRDILVQPDVKPDLFPSSPGLEMVSPPAATDQALNEVQQELQKLYGTWKVVSMMDGGKAKKLPAGKDMQVTFEKRWTTVSGSGPGHSGPMEENFIIAPGKNGKIEAVSFTIDVTTDPKRISWPQGMKNYSIYKIEGDRLTLCWAERPKDGRPTKFVSEKDSPNDRLMVLQRVKTAGEGTSPAASKNNPLRGAHGADPAAIHDSESDRRELRGLWRCVSVKDRHEETTKNHFYIFFGTDFVQRCIQENGSCPLTIDATTTPKRIGWPMPCTKDAYSIYKLEGDRLTICCGTGRSGRSPSDFNIGKDSPNVLLVFEREKPFESTSADAIRKRIAQLEKSPYALITCMSPHDISLYEKGLPMSGWAGLVQCMVPLSEKYETAYFSILGQGSELLQKHFKIFGPTTILLKNGKEIFRHEGNLKNPEKLCKEITKRLPPIRVDVNDDTLPPDNKEKVVYLSVSPVIGKTKQYANKTLRVTWPEGLKVYQLTKGYQNLGKNSVEWVIPEDLANKDEMAYHAQAGRFIYFRTSSSCKQAEFVASLLDKKGEVEWSVSIKHDIDVNPTTTPPDYRAPALEMVSPQSQTIPNPSSIPSNKTSAKNISPLTGVWKLVERPNAKGSLIATSEKEKMPEVTATLTDKTLYLRGKEIINQRFSYEISPDGKNINLVDGRDQAYRGVMQVEKDGKRLILVVGDKKRPAGVWDYFGPDYDRLVLEKTAAKPDLAALTDKELFEKKWFWISSQPTLLKWFHLAPNERLSSDSLAGKFFFHTKDSHGGSAASENTLFRSEAASGLVDGDRLWPKNWACAIDSSATPKRMDLITDKGAVFKGIYKIADYRLKVRFDSQDQPRLKDFSDATGHNLIEFTFAYPPPPTPESATILLDGYKFLFDGKCFDHFDLDFQENNATPTSLLPLLKRHPRKKIVLESYFSELALIHYRRQLLDAGMESVEIKLIEPCELPYGFSPLEYELLKDLPKIVNNDAEDLKKLDQKIPVILSCKAEARKENGQVSYMIPLRSMLSIHKVSMQENGMLHIQLDPLSTETFKKLKGKPSDRVAIWIRNGGLVFATPTLESLRKGTFDIDLEFSDAERKILLDMLGEQVTKIDKMHGGIM